MFKVLHVSVVYTVWITVLFTGVLIRAESATVNDPALVHKNTSTSVSVTKAIREREGKQKDKVQKSDKTPSAVSNAVKPDAKKKAPTPPGATSKNAPAVQSDKVVSRSGVSVPFIAGKSTVHDQKTTVTKDLEVKTSGALMALQPSPRPVFTPVGTRGRSFSTTLRKSSAVIGDPLGTLGWFSGSWTPFISLPRDASEWAAWHRNVEARKKARLQAVLERREAFLNAYIKRTAKVAATLYVIRVINQGQELFGDRSLSVQKEAALKTQISAEMERLQPSFDQIEETRSELGKLSARTPEWEFRDFDFRSNSAPSCWWLGGQVENVLRSLHECDPVELMEAEKEAEQFEKLLADRHGDNVSGTFQNDSLATRPESFVPQDTPMPFFDSQLPLSAPEPPKLATPSVHGVEAATTSLKARVVNLAPGTVEFAGTVPSCGVVVIVSHAGNLYSVYSFLAQTMVSQGQLLQVGEEIGTPGTLPRKEKDQRGCRFEVRHDDKPVTVTTLREFRDAADLLRDPS